MIFKRSLSRRRLSVPGPRSLSGLFVVSGMLLALLTGPADTATASDTATRWETFSESTECNGSYTRPPMATKTGLLTNAERILGPFGTYFGRTIGEVRAELVPWTMPGSNGRRVLVHRAAFPAFQQVAANLADHAAQGRVYPVDSVGAFYPRTVGGSHQVSRHGLGTAIDINPAQNPYRADGKLITNFPSWFVDAWRAAGFCWGGDWNRAKDAMHFSWMGPSTGFGEAATPRPPSTSKSPFGPIDRAFITPMSPVMDRYQLMVTDAIGNGAPDVIGLRAHPDGAVIDISMGRREFGSCSVTRRFVEDQSILGADHTLLMDLNGDSRQDLVTLTGNGSDTTIRTALNSQSFDQVDSFSRSISNVVAAAGADFDGDHRADLWVARSNGTLDIYAGPSFSNTLHSSTLPSGAPAHISAADRDGGNTPELFALYSNGSSTLLEVLSNGTSWSVEQSLNISGSSVDSIVAVGATDYDGDGRADFLILDDTGRLTARIGNTATGASTTGWFVDPDPDCSHPILLDFEGSFYDDETSVHVNGIEWIAAEGITAGCNPPYNDAFCPRANLTRAQAATFVVRAMGLPPASKDFFVDDQGHVLEGGINRVAEAGITVGCNPPANDRFCPNAEMTRAQFAAFMARALGLPSASTDYFTDDTGNVLERAINRLAESGITSGCNPPANDRFCPNRTLTRAETATFLTRAFKD